MAKDELRQKTIIRTDGTNYTRWEGEYRDLNNSRRYASHENRDKAREKLKRKQEAVKSGERVARRENATWKEAWQEWMEAEEAKSAAKLIWGNTIDNYRWSRLHLPMAFGNKKVKDLDRRDIEEWVHKKLATEYKPGKTYKHKSVDNLYGYMLLVLEHAGADRLRNHLRQKPVKIFPNARSKKRIDIPSYEGMERLIKFLAGPKPQWAHELAWANRKIIFALGFNAGLRPGEISALHTRSVNLPHRTLEVLPDEGSNSKWDKLKEPKSPAGARHVPIRRYLYDACVDHFATVGFDGFVVKNRLHPDKPLPMNDVSDNFRELMRDAELTKPDSDEEILWPAHANRHFHISARLLNGESVLVIAEEVGHEDASTTLKTYGHVLKGHRDIAPIWKERFQLSAEGQGRLIEGEVIEYKPEPLAIECSRPWPAEAVRLLQSGWKPAAVAKHLGQHRTTINTTFHKLGLPPPNKFVLEARDKRYQELYEKGYGDQEIAKLTNTGRVTVTNWRQTFENGVPNTRKALLELRSDLRQNRDEGENTQ